MEYSPHFLFGANRQWSFHFLTVNYDEADQSPPSSAEVKQCMELYFHSPNTPSWRGAELKKHRDTFTFTFTFTLPYLTLTNDDYTTLHYTALNQR
jgi:hypothetical protein